MADSPPLLIFGLFLYAVCKKLFELFFYNLFVFKCILYLFSATSIVVPCMTTMASHYGSDAHKGKAMGTFRSLGALARAVGPVFASIC